MSNKWGRRKDNNQAYKKSTPISVGRVLCAYCGKYHKAGSNILARHSARDQTKIHPKTKKFFTKIRSEHDFLVKTYPTTSIIPARNTGERLLKYMQPKDTPKLIFEPDWPEQHKDVLSFADRSQNIIWMNENRVQELNNFNVLTETLAHEVGHLKGLEHSDSGTYPVMLPEFVISPRIKEEFERNKKEWRKDWRWSYKNMALNMYGKRTAELSTEQKETVLDELLAQQWKMYGYRYGKQFKQYFEEVFSSKGSRGKVHA